MERNHNTLENDRLFVVIVSPLDSTLGLALWCGEESCSWSQWILLETIRKLRKSFRLCVSKWSETKCKLNHHSKKFTQIQGKIGFEASDLEAHNFPAIVYVARNTSSGKNSINLLHKSALSDSQVKRSSWIFPDCVTYTSLVLMVTIVVFVGNTELKKKKLVNFLARSHHVVNLETIAVYLSIFYISILLYIFVLGYHVSRKKILKKIIWVIWVESWKGDDIWDFCLRIVSFVDSDSYWILIKVFSFPLHTQILQPEALCIWMEKKRT